MDRTRLFAIGAIGGGLLLGVTGAAQADQSVEQQLKDQNAQIQALKAELAEVKGTSTTLSARQTQEVKALVNDVMSDSRNRQSLSGGGLVGGHDGHFFLANENNTFRMNISGLIQVRWYGNFRDNSGDDDAETGFEVARARVQFDGHIYSENLFYRLRLEVDHNSNSVYGNNIVVGWKFSKTFKAWMGEDYAPFMREETIGPDNQLAVEQSIVADLFGLGTVQGVFIQWDPMERLSIIASVNDGSRSGEPNGGFPSVINSPSDPAGLWMYQYDHSLDAEELNKNFAYDDTDWAITGRVQYRVFGKAAQEVDFSAKPEDEMFLLIGAAAHWEVAETGGQGGTTGPNNVNGSFFEWTLDASFKWKGFSAYISGVGLYTDNKNGGPDFNSYGMVAQAAYNFKMGSHGSLEPFGRYEGLFFDGDLTGGALPDSNVNLITFGVNWYQHGQDAKATLDFVWCLNTFGSDIYGMSRGYTGLLPDGTNQDNQFVVRFQYQLRF